MDEAITLASGVVDIKPDTASLKRITAELSQSDPRTKAKKRFRIYDHRVLAAGERNAGKQQVFMVHLALLKKRPRKRIRMHRGYRFILFLSLLGLLGLLGLPRLGYLEGLPYQTPLIILLALIGVLSAYKLLKGASLSEVFYTAHGKVPVIRFFYKQPDRKSYKAFIKTLKRDIARLKKDEQYASQSILSAEMAEHRRLYDEGVIGQAQYEDAKRRILGKH